jgi:hypothetical protein
MKLCHCWRYLLLIALLKLLLAVKNLLTRMPAYHRHHVGTAASLAGRLSSAPRARVLS